MASPQKEGLLSENKSNGGLSSMAGKKSPPPKPNAFAWLVNPSVTFKLIAFPALLWAILETLVPSSPNPFAPMLFIQHRVASTSPSEPIRYQKGYLDVVFVLYYILVFFFFRAVITKFFMPIARHFDVKKSKLHRFGQQGYEMIYYAVMGVWGLQVMYNLPTWWFDTKHYWTGYPEWQLDPSMKRYYLTHIAYWSQLFVTMILGLERLPREMWIHHFVTMYLILSSYIINMTFIGNAVYVCMDIPDVLHSFSKLLNYMKFERAKIVSLGFFIVVWTYFRHYLSIRVLMSTLTEFHLIPDAERILDPENGNWMPWWAQHLLFSGLGALQLLNMLWYFRMMRLLFRAIRTFETSDEYSDDEDDEQDNDKPLENKKSR